MKSRWTRHVERERRWECLECSKSKRQGMARLGDIVDEAVIMKRILIEWGMRVGVRMWRIGFIITVTYISIARQRVDKHIAATHEHATIE
jgi:hypothetical protein